MIALDVADLAVIAGRTLGIDSAAAFGLLDIVAAQDALDRVADHEPGYPAAAQAAVLLHALAARPPLPRGHRSRSPRRRSCACGTRRRPSLVRHRPLDTGTGCVPLMW